MPLPTAPPRRLPTVEMYHKKSGKIRTVNATVYVEEYLTNPNWTTQSPKVSGYREGNVPKAVVIEDKREYELNKHRLEDPQEARKRGDLDRAQAESKISVRSQLAWRKMPWHKRRKYIEEQTGTMPKNKVEAEELMKDK